MTNAEKEYKKLWMKNIKNIRKNFQMILKTLLRRTQRNFGNSSRAIKEKKQPYIETDIFYDFFKNINSANAEEENVFLLDNLPVNVNENINGYISQNVS